MSSSLNSCLPAIGLSSALSYVSNFETGSAFVVLNFEWLFCTLDSADRNVARKPTG